MVENSLQIVIECYCRCISKNLIKLEEIPERYKKLVEVYYNEMEKKNANS